MGDTFACTACVDGTRERKMAGSILRRVFKLANAYQVELIGGDTTRGPLNICVTIIGEVAKGNALRRRGARSGDDIWISGHLGDAALALAHRKNHIVLEADEIEACLLPR